MPDDQERTGDGLTRNRLTMVRELQTFQRLRQQLTWRGAFWCVPTCIIGVCCSLSLKPAYAETRARARIDNLSFQLIDLDPSDGVQPWMEWHQNSDKPGSIKAVRLTEGTFTLAEDVSSAAMPFTPSENAIGSGYYFAIGGVTGTGEPEGSSLFAEAHLAPQPSGATYQRALDALIFAPYFYTEFTLSANSELRVTANISIDIEDKDQAANFFEDAFGAADIAVSFQPGFGTERKYVDYWQSLSSRRIGQWAFSSSLRDTAVISVLNDSENVGIGRISAYVDASTEISSVPEPVAVLLWLAGISVVSLVASFRQRLGCLKR